MLTAGSAIAGPTGSNAAEADKLLSNATDWFNGKGKYGSAKVSYDGPVIELLSSSHLPAVAGIAKLQRKGFDNLDAPIVRVGGLDVPIPYNDVLEREVIPSQDRLMQAIRELVQNEI